MRYTIMQLDNMEGHDFEYAVADLLFHNGWRDVEVTQGSGDYGIDILARRKNVKYGIQCKRYSGNVGVKAVQEALSGTEFYHCNMAAVITNSTYTKQAENLARTSGVRLFGREFLIELIENYEDEYDKLDPERATVLAGHANNIAIAYTGKNNVTGTNVEKIKVKDFTVQNGGIYMSGKKYSRTYINVLRLLFLISGIVISVWALMMLVISPLLGICFLVFGIFSILYSRKMKEAIYLYDKQYGKK